MQTRLTESQIEIFNSQLFDAIQEKNNDKVLVLIAKGADLAAKNKKERTPIQCAADTGCWEIVETIAKNKKDDKKRYCYGSALYAAATKNRTETVKCLLSAGAVLTWRNKMVGSSLHWAVRHNNAQMISLLVAHGMDLSFTNAEDQTALDLAKQLNRIECIDLLNKANEKVLLQAIKRTDYVATITKDLKSIEQYREFTHTLYAAMCENGFKAKHLPAALKMLTICHNRLLKEAVINLNSQRDQLKSNVIQDPDYFSLKRHATLEKLNLLIANVNTFINYPNIRTQPNCTLNLNIPEENDIRIYLDHKHAIEDYICRLHIFLTEVKMKLANCKAKNFLGIWVDADLSAPLQKVRRKLARLSNTACDTEILDTYEEVNGLLQFASKLNSASEQVNRLNQHISQLMNWTTFIAPQIYSKPFPAIQNTSENGCLLGDIVTQDTKPNIMPDINQNSLSALKR